ncbi:MAG: PQQ-binding-like beta-propeller repeat protein [Thermoguttaceae bacterium]|jgi:outer membrane protein assembly factor BamB
MAVLAGLWLTVAACISAGAAERNVGWRGDGTGKYPAADPPTRWGRLSVPLQGLRFMARKPLPGDAGTPMPDGVIRDWFILGPVPFAEGAKIEEDTVPDEPRLAPDEGQETAGRTWQKVTLDTAYLDFARLIGKPGDAVAYACSHVYAPAAGTFRMNLTYVGTVRVCINGKASQEMGGVRFKLDLVKGWNRILLKVSAGSKEATGVADWYVVPVLHAWAPCEYRQTNIAWRTPLPAVQSAFYGAGTGVGSPVIVGQRIYVLSEPHDLVAIDRADGKVRWIRRTSAFEAATSEEKQRPAYQEAEAVAAKIDALNAALVAGTASAEQLNEKKAELEKNLQKRMKRVDPEKYAPEVAPDVGFSGFTPSSDGQFLYMWFGDGVTACYDLDGNRRWIRMDRRTAVEHGFSSSPLLIDGKFVVFMRDLMAFEATTGKPAWQIPLVSREGLNPEGFFHGSPVAAAIGGVPVLVLGNGGIVRARDGKLLCAAPDMGNQAVASPVVEANRLFHLPTSHSDLVVRTLPGEIADPLHVAMRKIPFDLSSFPKHYLPWQLSSPVIHEGLAYLMNNAGVLTVVDVEAGKVVYQRMLDLDPLQAHNEGAARGLGVSPALAGKYLYFLGNNGAAVVLRPGRVFRQIAKNKIESVVMAGHWAERQERFVASPVFDGSRLYLRGEGALYAVADRP